MEYKQLLGQILENITIKVEWYNKVFNEEITSKWKEEIINQEKDTKKKKRIGYAFDCVLNFAKATAQGSRIQTNCNWKDECEECMEEAKQKAGDEDSTQSDIEDEYYDIVYGCRHKRCECHPADFDLPDYISYSRWTNKKIIPDELHMKLNQLIAEMIEKVEVDWHPGSNQMVRDIVHPSKYCYVKGVSKLKDGSIEKECEEVDRYQWLPSEFDITSERVQSVSYINNLDQEKFPNATNLIEQTIHCFIPDLEEVLKVNLSNKRLQIITKIACAHLDNENPIQKDGSWHVEGMPYEHIAATCIYYLDVHGITSSFLEFRKPVIFNEDHVSYPQDDAAYSSCHFGIDTHHHGEMNRYLGLIKCDQSASVVFPNSIQHRVKGYKLLDNNAAGFRSILVFFVIDPEVRVLSTFDVPPQYNFFSKSEADHHRERLMIHRKYIIASMNSEIFERQYSLCEH